MIITDLDTDTDLSDIPDFAVVLFSGATCGPCQQIKTYIDNLDIESDYRAIYIADVADHKDLSRSLGLRSVPTLVRLEDGEEVDRANGFEATLELLEDFLLD